MNHQQFLSLHMFSETTDWENMERMAERERESDWNDEQKLSFGAVRFVVKFTERERESARFCSFNFREPITNLQIGEGKLKIY